MIRKTGLILLTLLVNAHPLFAAAFPEFEGTVRIPVGNHGSASITLLDPNHLKTTSSYLPHAEEIILDLQSGLIDTTTTNYGSTAIVEKKQYPAAQQGGAYLPWRNQLLGMINATTWILQNLHFLSPKEKQSRTVEMQAVLNYLNAFLAKEDSTAPDSVTLEPYQAPKKLRRGISYSYSVEYLARADRDILLEVFDAQWRYLTGVRVRVPSGHDTAKGTIQIPTDVSTPQDGFVAVKLVPADAPWTDKLAEFIHPILLQNLQTIESVFTSWSDYTTVPSLWVYVTYYCPGTCDVQVDLFDKNGNGLAGQVIPADAPYIQDGEQFSSLNFATPSPLFQLGETYTYSVKIKPRDGASNQAYAEVQGSFVAGH